MESIEVPYANGEIAGFKMLDVAFPRFQVQKDTKGTKLHEYFVWFI